jgi:hypothetical protein
MSTGTGRYVPWVTVTFVTCLRWSFTCGETLYVSNVPDLLCPVCTLAIAFPPPSVTFAPDTGDPPTVICGAVPPSVFLMSPSPITLSWFMSRMAYTE